MKRIVLIALFSTVVFAGCNKTVNEVLGSLGFGGALEAEAGEQPAVKLDRETRYYNDFLGVSYAIPKNWWLYEVDEANFGESKGDVTDEVAMNLGYNEFENYAYTYLYCVSFGNLESSASDNHLGFHLDAQFLEGVSGLSGFMEYFEAYMLEPAEGKEYSLLDSRSVSINGKPFELRDYLVTAEDGGNFHIMTLSCEVKEGYVLNIAVDYWPENTRAKDTIIESVGKSLELY